MTGISSHPETKKGHFEPPETDYNFLTLAQLGKDLFSFHRLETGRHLLPAPSN